MYVYYYICVCVLVPQLCLILCSPMGIACQAPLSMQFSRQECWSGLPFSSPGKLPDTGIEHMNVCMCVCIYCLYMNKKRFRLEKIVLYFLQVGTPIGIDQQLLKCRLQTMGSPSTGNFLENQFLSSTRNSGSGAQQSVFQ